MTNPQNEALRSLFEAIGNYDADSIAGLLSDTATLVFPTRPAFIGPDGARRAIEELARTYVDWKPVPIRITGDGDCLAAEWSCTITDFGGSQSRLDGCAIADFQDGKIHRLRFYFRPEDARQ